MRNEHAADNFLDGGSFDGSVGGGEVDLIETATTYHYEPGEVEYLLSQRIPGTVVQFSEGWLRLIPETESERLFLEGREVRIPRSVVTRSIP